MCKTTATSELTESFEHVLVNILKNKNVIENVTHTKKEVYFFGMSFGIKGKKKKDRKFC
jgi:hypothetical protein